MRTLLLILFAGLALAAGAAAAAASERMTFQQLMDPGVFPDAQFGMQVESVVADGGDYTITTTGAVIHIAGTSGTLEFRQRLGHARTIATMRLPGALHGGVVRQEGPGFALLDFSQARVTIRVNGDSLLLLHAHDALEVAIERSIPVAWSSSFGANHLVADEWGGFALYCSAAEPPDHFDVTHRPLATYSLPADSVLCLGVCPPRPYAWQSSITDQVVWNWSDENAYPADALLDAWQAGGNILLLQSEAMLWADWHADFTPRLGVSEFERVRDRVHSYGGRLIVYTSPFYFLKGPDGNRTYQAAWVPKPGKPTTAYGDNMPLFLEAITAVMTRLKPDGLYFDNVYCLNPAALYALARQSRRVVGEKGLLEWHTTLELGALKGDFYMPHADAYTDLQLRGERRNERYADFDYLRFFVSGYNISNAMGVLCCNTGASRYMSPDKVDALLRANLRLHTLNDSYEPTIRAINTSPRLFITPAYVKYWSRLTPTLQEQVDAAVDARQAKLGPANP
jgi:hypothetical protein